MTTLLTDSPNITTEVKSVSTPDGEVIRVIVSADVEQEYISNTGWPGVRALPPYVDDLERDFGNGQFNGISIYDQMLYEPSALSSVGTLLDSAITGDPIISPALDEQETGFKQALLISDFCRQQLENLDEAFIFVLYEIISGAFTHGHKIAEKVFELRQNSLLGRISQDLIQLKTKPNHSSTFVVDDRNNEIGVAFAPSGRVPVITPDATGRSQNLLPMSKLAIARYQKKNGDPRGTSGLRSAYHAWWTLQQTYDSLRRYIAIYGTPPIVGELPPGIADKVTIDKTTGRPFDNARDPVTNLTAQLKKLRAAGVIGVQSGTKIYFLEPKGDGAVYSNVISIQERRMVQSILFATRSLLESAHGSRADSLTAQDIVGLRVRSIRRMAEEFIRYQLFRPAVIANFGAKYIPLLPRVSMGKTEQQDLPAVLTAMASAYAAHFIQDDQLPELHSELNIPSSVSLKEKIKTGEPVIPPLQPTPSKDPKADVQANSGQSQDPTKTNQLAGAKYGGG